MSAVYRGSSIPNTLARDLKLILLTGGFFLYQSPREREKQFLFLLITVTSRRSECSVRSYLTLSRVGRKESTAQNLRQGFPQQEGSVKTSAGATGGVTTCENKHLSVRARLWEQRRRPCRTEVSWLPVFPSSARVTGQSKHRDGQSVD